MKQATMLFLCLAVALQLLAQPIPSSSGIGFSANDTVGCVPHVVHFSNLAPNTISWQWDFGNGSTSNQENPVTMFNTGGIYTVTLDVTYANGGTEHFEKTDYIEVLSKPQIDIDITNFSPCINENSIQLQNNTSGAAQFLWDFGDGHMTTDINPYHHYSSPGSYVITFFATNAGGCASDTSLTKTILPVTQNGFQIVGTTQTCDSSHAFSFDASPGGLNSYSWEFSDGTALNGSSVQHAFNAFGSFGLLLITTDANGCTDSTYSSNAVEITDYADSFSVSATNVCEMSSVTFQANTSGATSVLWDFGDGQQANGNSVSHTYQTSGVYDVTMTVTHTGGCTQTITENDLITVGTPTNISISLSDSIVCVGEDLQLEVTGTIPSSILWTLGDGGTDTSTLFTHTYGNAGQYTVSLIQDYGACSDTLLQTVTVTHPTANFQNTSFSNCAPANVQFNSSSPTAVSWEWTFSNGATSFNEHPIVLFNTPGNYDAQLVVADANGCSDSTYVSDALVVSNNAPLDFQSSNLTGCAPFSVTLYNYSGSVGFWNWNFGDGTTGSGNTPTHTYSAPGEYVVSLNTMDSLGCSTHIDTFAIVSVNTLQIDSLAANLDCDSLLVDLSISCPDCSSGTWNFGDGSDTIVPNVSHEYAATGEYNVYYTGISSQGCMGVRLIQIDFDSCTVQHPSINSSSPVSGDPSNWTSDSTPTTTAPYSQYCGPITVTIQNPVPNATNWTWHFGDGEVGYGPIPTHTYDSTGLFSLMLIHDDSTLADTLYFHNFINVIGHTNSIVVNSSSYCNDMQVNLSSSNTALTHYYWSIDNTMLGSNSPAVDTLFSNSNQLHSITLTTLDSNMCSYSASIGVFSNGIVPQFAFDSSLCVGDSLQVTHQLSSNYTIDYSIGGVAVPDTSFYAFANSGTFPFTATVSDINGCETHFDLGNVHVHDVNSQFNLLTSSSLCLGDTIVLAASDTNNDSYVWYLDNTALTSNGPTLSSVLNNSGTYDITLQTSSNGCYSSTTQQTAYVVNEAIADFSFTQDRSCLPLQSSFTDLSISPVSWQWDFGDGSGSQLQHPTHIYNAVPNGQVTLTIVDTNGCRASITKDNIDLLQADINISASTGCAPANISFSSSAQNILSWNWNFGDGSVDTVATPTHTYYDDGQYNVSLTVTDVDGCYDSINVPALVSIDKVEAHFLSSVSSGCAPQPAFFTDSSYNAVSWSWNFGNNATSSQQNPVQAYYVGGNYNVQLIVESATGCADTMVSPITIMGPQANFLLLDSFMCETDSLEFINNSQNASAFTWLFGDGNSSNEATPVHQYMNSGSYDISLIATDASGCQHIVTQTQQITVENLPNPLFSLSDTVGCNPLPIHLSAQSPGLNYQWIIDGNLSGSGYSHSSLLNTGNHSISMIATSANGCVDSATVDSVIVHPVYNVQLSPLAPVCETADSVIVNTTCSMGNWYIDGIPNATNVFDISSLPQGDYTLLQVVDTYCGDMDSVTLHIDSLITASIQTSQIVCEGDDPFIFQASPNLGYWSGPGVIDPYTGLVAPDNANYGPNLLTYTVVNGSCLFIDTAELIVNRLPNATFSIQNDVLCEGNLIQLSTLGANSAANYDWTFVNTNDTLKETTANPSVFLNPGNWNIDLVVSDNGCVNSSSLDSIWVHDTLAPNSPSIIRSTVEDNEVVLTEWEDPLYGDEKISSFQIWRSIDSVNFSFIESVEKSKRSFIDNEVNVHDQNYYYLIIPENVCNVAPEKNPMSSSILLEQEKINDEYLNFKWTKYYQWLEGVDYYELQKRTAGGEWETIKVMEADENGTTIAAP